jgi:dolichyl-phosphate beta-glucosyltransferase
LISVVIPVFNESKRLVTTVADIVSFAYQNPGVIGELVLVDDASTDRSIDSVMQYSSRIKMVVCCFQCNMGKWAALSEGIRRSSCEFVLLLDADGSASVFELSRSGKFNWAMRNGVALFGSRFMPESLVLGKSRFRLFVSQIYRAYAIVCLWFVSGKFVDDPQAPFKFFVKDKLAVESMRVNRFAGDVEFLLCYSGSYEVVPLLFIHRGGSKVSLSSAVRMFVDTFLVVFRYVFNRRKSIL